MTRSYGSIVDLASQHARTDKQEWKVMSAKRSPVIWQGWPSLTGLIVIDRVDRHWQSWPSLSGLTIIDRVDRHWQRCPSLTALSVIDRVDRHRKDWPSLTGPSVNKTESYSNGPTGIFPQRSPKLSKKNSPSSISLLLLRKKICSATRTSAATRATRDQRSGTLQGDLCATSSSPGLGSRRFYMTRLFVQPCCWPRCYHTPGET